MGTVSFFLTGHILLYLLGVFPTLLPSPINFLAYMHCIAIFVHTFALWLFVHVQQYMYDGCSLCNFITYYHCTTMYASMHMLRLHISEWHSGLCMLCIYRVCGTCVVFMYVKVQGHSSQHNVTHAQYRISPLYLCEHPVNVIDFVKDAHNMVIADNSPQNFSLSNLQVLCLGVM